MLLISRINARTVANRSRDLCTRAKGSFLEKERNSIRFWMSTTQKSLSKNKKSLSSSSSPPQPVVETGILNSKNHFMNKKREEIWMSFSEIAGNLSFICVTLAYINTDIFWLRGLAMGSISLSIVFQFYRPQPLWIPIRWNFLLLAINIVMMTELFIERHRANTMPHHLEGMFQDGYFEERGFSRIEFNKLFRIGKRAKFTKGEFLTLDGEKNERLYFVMDGEIAIFKNELKLATVSSHNFIGELAFLDYAMQANDTLPSASADAMVEADKVYVWVWDFDQLKHFLATERAISNALSAYINHDLRKKLIATGVAMSDLDNTDCSLAK